MTNNKGESMVLRRFVTLAVSCCLVLGAGLARVDQSFAQGEATKAAQPPTPPAAPAKTDTAGKDASKTDTASKDAQKPDATKALDQAKTPDASKTEAPKAPEPPPPPIPPEVQAKIDAARKAVAEAIVACQDAGLVDTSIDPPPILDILITGRATDKQRLKGQKPYAVNPEVFGAWFTGYGKKELVESINYVDDVRVISPSDGLKNWYDQRAHFLEQYIQDIRKAKGPAPAANKEAAKPAEPAKTPDAAKPGAATKAAEPKKN
jgi:hypothetical protein